MRLSPTPAPRRDVALRRVAPALFVALMAVAIAGAPVAAATYKVTMNEGYDFQPRTRSVNRGDIVKWKNNANFEVHDVRATAPNGLFASPGGKGGLAPGETYSRVFRSAGTYPYVCLEHSADGMKGKIRVPMSARRIDGGERFRLTVATATAPSGYRHDIWVDRPGASGWQHWLYTTGATATYDPSTSGLYKFKSRLQRTSNGQASKFSPVVTATH